MPMRFSSLVLWCLDKFIHKQELFTISIYEDLGEMRSLMLRSMKVQNHYNVNHQTYWERGGEDQLVRLPNGDDHGFNPYIPQVAQWRLGGHGFNPPTFHNGI